MMNLEGTKKGKTKSFINKGRRIRKARRKGKANRNINEERNIRKAKKNGKANWILNKERKIGKSQKEWQSKMYHDKVRRRGKTKKFHQERKQSWKDHQYRKKDHESQNEGKAKRILNEERRIRKTRSPKLKWSSIKKDGSKKLGGKTNVKYSWIKSNDLECMKNN